MGRLSPSPSAAAAALRGFTLWAALAAPALASSPADLLSPPQRALSHEGRVLGGADRWVEAGAALSWPLLRSSTRTFAASLSAARLRWDRTIRLDSGAAIPRALSRAEAGVQYFRRLPARAGWGLRASVGSAGDRLFREDRDAAFSLTAFYLFPSAGPGGWAAALYLGNNGPLADYVPVPGFVYSYRTEAFSGFFGLPFAWVRWAPSPWSFTASAFGPTGAAEAAFGAKGRPQAFAAFGWERERYLLHGRRSADERLTLERKSLSVGARGRLAGPVSAELRLGRDFDRRAYVGEGLFDKDGGFAALRPGGWLAWSLRAIF